MHNRTKFSLGGVFIGLAVAYLIYSGMSETAAYYLTVREAASGEYSRLTDTVRVKGQVRTGSVAWDQEEVRLTFVLTDGQADITVSYYGVVPDLFAEGQDLIVEGRLSPQGIIAESVLASCPSKYESQPVANADRTSD